MKIDLQVSFLVADALEQPFPDAQFDLVWSMESGEHMPDKRKVSSLLYTATTSSFFFLFAFLHLSATVSVHPLCPTPSF